MSENQQIGLTGTIREDGLLVVGSIIYDVSHLPKDKQAAIYHAEKAPEPERKKGKRIITLYDLNAKVYKYEEEDRKLTQAEMIEEIYEVLCGGEKK